MPVFNSSSPAEFDCQLAGGQGAQFRVPSRVRNTLRYLVEFSMTMHPALPADRNAQDADQRMP